TPITQDSRSSGTTASRLERTTQELATQVQQNWATARVSDYKDTKLSTTKLFERMEEPRGVGISEQMQRLEIGQPDQDKLNTTGKKKEQLNPAWVAQLMGTTLKKIFFVPLVIQLLNKQQK